MSSEKLVKDALKKYLKSIGAYYYMPVPMGYGAATVDVFICYKGRFYAVECKRPGIKDPTIRQTIVLTEIALAGGGVWLENSTQLEATKRVLF